MCDDAEGAEDAVKSAPSASDAAWLRVAISTVRPNCSIANISSAEAGGRRSTAIVRFADAEPIVVRGEQNGVDGGSVATEGVLLRAITDETTVPVATPLGWGSIADEPATGRDGDQSVGAGDEWIATRFIEGDNLHERFCRLGSAERRDIVGTFGRYLGELHAGFRFDGYGQIVAENGTLRIGSGSNSEERPSGNAWHDWLVDRGRESLDRLPTEFDDIAEAARNRLDEWSVEAAPVPRLFPWDLRPGNALVSDGEITAIIDWESPLAAGAALSVAKAEYLLADWYVPDEADALRRAFRAGYTEVRSLPVVDDVHRIVAVAETAVDSGGQVTNPRYPPINRDAAVQFHRKYLGSAAGDNE